MEHRYYIAQFLFIQNDEIVAQKGHEFVKFLYGPVFRTTNGAIKDKVENHELYLRL